MFLIFILVLWVPWIAFCGLIGGFFGLVFLGIFLPIGVLSLFASLFGKLIQKFENAPYKCRQQALVERRAVHWIGLDGIEVAAVGYQPRMARSTGIMHTICWMLGR